MWLVNFLIDGALRALETILGMTRNARRVLIIVVGAMTIGGLMTATNVLSIGDIIKEILRLEHDKKAPTDYGYGPGVHVGAPRPNLRLGQTPAKPKSARVNALAIPNSGGLGGFFGPPVTWPIIDIAPSPTSS